MTDNGDNITQIQEQRRICIEKMEKDLDDYVSTLERKPYTDGWSEDNWEEEMEKHPFFMSQAPKEDEDLPPLLEAMQQLKYDPEENTSEELARNYKEDGNHNFKLKKYRFAVANYTEGLRQKCNDEELNSQLYGNRAAAHYFLENYRSCLNDCIKSRNLKPDNLKVVNRAIHCCQHLQLYSDAIRWCDFGLEHFPKEKIILQLRSDLERKMRAKERDERKDALQKRKEKAEEEKLLSVINSRGICVKIKSTDGDPDLDLSSLEPSHPAALHKRVHLNETGELLWPVLFLYPEYGETDFIEEFHENATFFDHLLIMFGESRPTWDVEQKYYPERLQLYFEDINEQKLYKIKQENTLLQAISHERFQVSGGTPAFIILVEGSKFETDFLKRYAL